MRTPYRPTRYTECPPEQDWCVTGGHPHAGATGKSRDCNCNVAGALRDNVANGQVVLCQAAEDRWPDTATVGPQHDLDGPAVERTIRGGEDIDGVNSVYICELRSAPAGTVVLLNATAHRLPPRLSKQGCPTEGR
jgi:hypothetical protein